MKTFDCVEMKRRGANQLNEQLKGKTRKEILAFWKDHTEVLREYQRKLSEERDDL